MATIFDQFIFDLKIFVTSLKWKENHNKTYTFSVRLYNAFYGWKKLWKKLAIGKALKNVDIFSKAVF